MTLQPLDRDQWQSLGSQYLAHGYLAQDGSARPQLLGDLATAAVYRLLRQEVSPQELALTVEGVVQLLPVQQGAPGLALAGALQESLVVVARAIRQPNNGGLVEWLNYCVAPVDSPAALQAFLDHAQAVVRRYAMLVAGLPPGWPLPSS